MVRGTGGVVLLLAAVVVMGSAQQPVPVTEVPRQTFPPTPAPTVHERNIKAVERLQHIDQCGGRDMEEVIRSYSPHLIFHEKEQFFPSSVEWYLNITNLRMVARVVHWAPVPAEELKFYGDETYLIKGTWWSGEKIFNNPGEFNDPSARSGDSIVAPAYVTTERGSSVEGDYVNVHYNFFFPYNGPQTMYFNNENVVLAGVGDHQGDWERVVVRLNTECTKPMGVATVAHGDYTWIRPLELRGKTEVRELHTSVYVALFTHGMRHMQHRWRNESVAGIAIGDTTEHRGGSRATWSSTNAPLVYISEKTASESHPWVLYGGRWGPKATSIELPDDIHPGWNLRGVYAGLGTSQTWRAAALTVYGSPFVDKEFDLNGPVSPWYAGSYTRSKWSILWYISAHSDGEYRYYTPGAVVDGSNVVVVGAHQRVVGHNGGMVRYAGGVVDGKNVLVLNSGQRVVGHNGRMTRFAGGSVDGKHVVILNRDEKVVSHHCNFERYCGGYVDGTNVKIVKMKKATPPPHWCSDAGAVNYEGDFDGDQILDHFCWDGQGSRRRFWTYLSTKPPGSRGGSQQGTTSFCTEPGAVLSVEELNNDKKYDLLCTYGDHKTHAYSGTDGVGLSSTPTAPHKKILSLTGGLFDASLATTGVENPNDPSARAYSVIGQLDKRDYDHWGGGFMFELRYTYADGTKDVLVWKQTSWLTEGVITGFVPVSLPTLDTRAVFKGLGRSSNNETYLDGNGVGRFWWNAVGPMVLYREGIPAYDWKVAVGQELYVWSP